MSAPLEIPDVQALSTRFRGAVLGPGDAEYDAARAVALGGIDCHPAVIVRVADAEDVRAVVALARETGLELAVRAGGHSGAGHSVVDGGIVLDLRDLTSLDVDSDRRTAWAGAGLLAGACTAGLAEHGLATGFGDTGTVGIAGITLGGGIGYLTRKHGMTIDNLLAAEIVTADGTVHVVDEAHEPDLFWAIRGGGGNFGVVTRLQFRLHPVDEVIGGMLFLPATPTTVAGLMRILDGASEDLSGIVNVMPCPPMPFVPEEHHGTTVILAMLCFAGPSQEAGPAIAPLRELATPLVDMVRPIRYPELYPPEAEGPHPPSILRTAFLDAFDEGQATRVCEEVASSDAPMRLVQLRALGGAAARVPVDATAYAHRERRFLANVICVHEGPADRQARLDWVEGLIRDLGPAEGAYANFLEDEGPERVRAAYPAATWDRLAAVKGRYDPDNLFRRNQNVPPVRGPG